MHRTTLTGALMCCAALAGCTGQSADGTPGDSPTAVGSPSPTRSAAVPGPVGSDTSGPSGESAPTSSAGGGTASSTPAAPGTRRRCRTSDLRASVGPNRPGAGQENFAIVLTNRSRHTCTVHGFPGVAFVDGTGQAVTPDPERATDERQQTVTLAPGASAWSAMVYTSPAITHVTTVTPAALLVTPPDETASISVHWTGGEVSNTGKASMPRVSPLRPGDGA
ncbi:DUF4232 domain-containing protein [Streptomyces sp. NPDC059679]|uniref:DUF4232 domain-containing protein n=1 Tax=Streptomyces sp. NPDC059679 TaxID=3346903 RepID=UPI0036BA244F